MTRQGQQSKVRRLSDGVNGTKPEQTRTVAVPEAARLRIAAAIATKEQAEQQLKNLVIVIAEALGIDGEIRGFDVPTGVISFIPRSVQAITEETLKEPIDV